MKKLLSVLLVFVMLVGFTACTKEEKLTHVFGITTMDNSNPFFVKILEVVQEKVEANGDKLIIVDAAQDQQKQNDGIAEMIEEGIDGIFLNPYDAGKVDPALDALNAAGIPIVNFDTSVNSIDKVNVFIGTKNYDAGKLCGEDLVKRLANGGKILILDIAPAESTYSRISGFMSAIDGKGFEVIARKDAQGDRNIAKEITTKFLQENSDIVAIFGANDPMALGANDALNEANRKDILVYGVDGSPLFLTEMSKEGSIMTATGVQSPKQMAEKTVQLMYDVLDGKALKERYYIDTYLISIDDVSKYDTSDWQ